MCYLMVLWIRASSTFGWALRWPMRQAGLLTEGPGEGFPSELTGFVGRIGFLAVVGRRVAVGRRSPIAGCSPGVVLVP